MEDFKNGMKHFEGQENGSIFDTWNKIAKSLDSDIAEMEDSTVESSDWAHFENDERSLAG